MCTEWWGSRDHADKISVDGSSGEVGWGGVGVTGLRKACLSHLPQVGGPSAEASLLQTPKKF